MAKKEAKKEKPPQKKNKKQNKRRFRVNKKLEGKTGTIFIGSEDPFLYFPDMMSYLERDEIEEVKLKARGRSISNAVNVSEQFKSRFKEINTQVKDFAERAKNKKLTPAEIEGSTFTISNLIFTLYIFW